MQALSLTRREYGGKRIAVSVIVEVPADHTFVIDEYLMPVLPVVRVRDFDEALTGALAADGGRGHTAMLHTQQQWANHTIYTGDELQRYRCERPVLRMCWN